MASWKDGEGQYTWGKFNSTSEYQDIYMVGGMGEGGTSDYFHIPAEFLNEARSRNYGTGIHFWRDGNKVNITINLLLINAGSNQRFVTNGYYVGNSSVEYPFYANIQYKKKSTGEWIKLGDNLITTNYGGMPLFKKDGWDTQNSGYLWKTFTYDLDLSDIAEFSIGVHGEDTNVYKWNYYKVEKVFKTEPPKPKPKLTGTLVVTYVDIATNNKLNNDKVVNGLEVGTTVTENYRPFSNYIVDYPNKSVTIRQGNNTISFYYTKVKNFIRPWAIRKSGIWKSLQSIGKQMKIRKNGNMIVPNNDIEQSRVNQDDYSPNRIRKSDKWKSQGKIGE